MAVRETYHIWWCKVAHDELMIALLDQFSDFIGHPLHRHFWLFVVCRDFRRGNHMPLFILILLLNSAVEEERNVSILFSLLERTRGSERMQGFADDNSYRLHGPD
jgi:hypothetical protein